MGARQKLNSVYGVSACAVAGVIGGLAQSWGVFAIALAVLLVAWFHSGSIRR